MSFMHIKKNATHYPLTARGCSGPCFSSQGVNVIGNKKLMTWTFILIRSGQIKAVYANTIMVRFLSYFQVREWEVRDPQVEIQNPCSKMKKKSQQKLHINCANALICFNLNQKQYAISGKTLEDNKPGMSCYKEKKQNWRTTKTYGANP